MPALPLLIRYVGVVLNRHVPAGPIGCEASFGLAHPIHRGSDWSARHCDGRVITNLVLPGFVVIAIGVDIRELRGLCVV